MPPYIVVNSVVFGVVGWEPDGPDREQYELRRLSAEEAERYRRVKRESEIELWANMQGSD